MAANPQALTHLLVNDTAIPLLSDGKSVWNDIQFKNYEGVAGYLPNSRFGVVKQRDEHQYTPFHQGLITPVEQMPRKGKATYSGYAVATRGQEVNRNLAAQFTADFDRKRVDGALSEQGKNVFKINADIEENRFKSAESATVHTQGGFFGTHANEISGVFHEPRSDWRGAFGATQ